MPAGYPVPPGAMPPMMGYPAGMPYPAGPEAGLPAGCEGDGGEGNGCKPKGIWFPGWKARKEKVEVYQPQSAYDIYQRQAGLHPALKKLFHCATPVPPPPPPPAASTGTLVFPNHPFARSPRDFFMEEDDPYGYYR
jgi:hypothetical protein